MTAHTRDVGDAAPEHDVVAYVGLGSNLGDRAAHLAAAVAALAATPGVEVLAVSRVYETEPVGPPQGPYLNAAVALRTRCSARALLSRLQAIERERGRRRTGVRNAARTLDLDLLLYDEACIDEPGLEVPHPRLRERPFVLEPLRDVAPDARHPISGDRIAELAARVRDRAAVRPTDLALEQEEPPPWPLQP